MKRTVLIAIVSSALILSIQANIAYGLGRVVGSSPQTNTLTVTVRVPNRVGIYLERDASIDLGIAPNVAHYPPNVYPGYYIDNTDFNSTSDLEVFCNSNAGWTLTVQASGDFDASLPISQLYYAPAGTPQTADAIAAPPAPWTSFSAAAPTNVASGGGMSAGWEAHHQDFQLQMLGSESAIDPGASVIMTYTITSP